MAIYDLGITEQLFLSLTWRELEALCRRKKQNDRRIELHSAQIAWLLYNINRSEKAPVLEIDDFLSGCRAKKNPQPQTDEDMKRAAMMITAAFNGTIQ